MGEAGCGRKGAGSDGDSGLSAVCYRIASRVLHESDEMVGLYVRIPKSWLTRLQHLAGERKLSVASLVRIYLREVLYDREAA